MRWMARLTTFLIVFTPSASGAERPRLPTDPSDSLKLLVDKLNDHSAGRPCGPIEHRSCRLDRTCYRRQERDHRPVTPAHAFVQPDCWQVSPEVVTWMENAVADLCASH